MASNLVEFHEEAVADRLPHANLVSHRVMNGSQQTYDVLKEGWLCASGYFQAPLGATRV